MIDLADSRDETVAELEIYDADDDEIITSRDVLRSDFNAAFEYHDFAIEFDTETGARIDSKQGSTGETSATCA